MSLLTSLFFPMSLGRDWTLDPLFPMPLTYLQTTLVWDILPFTSRWIRISLEPNRNVEKVMPQAGFDPLTFGSAVAHLTTTPFRLIVKSNVNGRSIYWGVWRSSDLCQEIRQEAFSVAIATGYFPTRGSDCGRSRNYKWRPVMADWRLILEKSAF